MSRPLTLMDVYVKLRNACREAGGQSAWCREHGISAAYVSDVLNARSEPGAKVLSALGLVKVVRYVPRKGSDVKV